jgi:hypothetical protein
MPLNFFPTSRLTQEAEKNTTDELRTRTNFQRFVNKAPHSAFKKLFVAAPSLLQGLRTMSLAKSAPGRLKPRKCERTKLCEPLPIPYISKKDEVQEEVARLRNLQIKTLLEKDATLNFPVWHKNGTKEAFYMHVMAALDAIKKRGHFKD